MLYNNYNVYANEFNSGYCRHSSYNHSYYGINSKTLSSSRGGVLVVQTFENTPKPNLRTLVKPQNLTLVKPFRKTTNKRKNEHHTTRF